MDAFEAIFENKPEQTEAVITPPETAPVEAAPPVEEATPAEAAEIVPEVPEPEQKQDAQPKDGKWVPLAMALDERDKRKALEAEVAAYRAKEAQQQPEAIPDPYDDPAGYSAFVADMTNRTALAVKFDLSEDMAVGVHGEEAVAAAKEWGAERAGQDPSFKQQFLSARNPIDWVVRQHKQDADLKLYQTDPVAFARRILEAQGQPVSDTAAIPAAGQQPMAPRQVMPPRSIASAPSSGGGARDMATGPLAALGAVFG
jgi:hypothetical protein